MVDVSCLDSMIDFYNAWPPPPYNNIIQKSNADLMQQKVNKTKQSHFTSIYLKINDSALKFSSSKYLEVMYDTFW